MKICFPIKIEDKMRNNSVPNKDSKERNEKNTSKVKKVAKNM